jgi:hypothetical protein
MRTFLLIIVAACCLLSCKKSESLTPGLFGKWELRRSYGGFSYRDSTYKAGNGTFYQFNKDSTYKYYIKNKQNEQGTFSIRKQYYSPGNPYQEIVFNNNMYGELITINGPRLTLGTSASDGIAVEYEKIGN